MYKFKVKVPLELEYRSNFDEHNFSHKNELEFEFSSSYSEFNYSLHGKAGEYTLLIDNIIAENENACIEKVKSFSNSLLPLASLIIQSRNSNQHYTHLKLDYLISNVNIEQQVRIDVQEQSQQQNGQVINLSDQMMIKEDIQITTSTQIDFSNLNIFFSHYNDKVFQYVLEGYYRSLSATDPATKFYNAFTIIEFMETYFRNDIETSHLLEKDEMEKVVTCLKENISINAERIVNRVKSTLLNATLESRHEKLIMILNNIFMIENIKCGIVNRPIDTDFVKQIIKIRNSLFHGKTFSEDEQQNIRERGLELICLIQNILFNWREMEEK
ncbi:MAG: hypothetical protein P794_09505 [Epsilonproteobacteria bacterium (ex Lamellibrachia satsuma)]|nr:MAG: hypothetical protein P794_09505 [Epsilonproteobacteria bacterium (ex Lamellibrachia satsuma)]